MKVRFEPKWKLLQATDWGRELNGTCAVAVTANLYVNKKKWTEVRQWHCLHTQQCLYFIRNIKENSQPPRETYKGLKKYQCSGTRKQFSFKWTLFAKILHSLTCWVKAKISQPRCLATGLYSPQAQNRIQNPIWDMNDRKLQYLWTDLLEQGSKPVFLELHCLELGKKEVLRWQTSPEVLGILFMIHTQNTQLQTMPTSTLASLAVV